MSSERVALTRIAVDRRVWLADKRPFDLGLRGLGNELVLLAQVHQQWRVETADLAQILLGVAAVIGDRSVGAVARGRQERHQSADAIAKDRNLAGALGQLGHNVGGVLDVLGAGVSVIGLIETKAVAPVGLGGDAEIDAWLLTPE
jgi:hypothetical protein